MSNFKTSALKLNPDNPRIIKDGKFKKLVDSIQSFPEMMEKRPMVCVTSEDGKLFPLEGNQRLSAIKSIGMKDIPSSWVVMADEWTPDQRREFLIKDNVGFGLWDWDLLANEFESTELEAWGLNIPNLEEEPELIDDEFKLQQAVCQYLSLQYPEALFMSDTIANFKLNKIQAGRNKTIQKQGFKCPDVMILHPRGKFSGLFIELKIKSPFQKNGKLYKDEHLEGQQKTINDLIDRGYQASFATGFNEARKIIDIYFIKRESD